ncbi:uncharacterized protein A4U43_C03F17850 [Asparagus officinalis]|uniref:Late embryogenesis abundant protein LEA-2 subgroup domain-containing protein n=1 Tax=Asparagus officinalis TaxID=4686 RepID=A0A5P1FG40_ASPOF|nr:uncharacterized protein A4U43_C03F17850 [Asparagus officinalis]
MGKLKFYGSEQPNHVQVVLIEFEFAVDYLLYGPLVAKVIYSKSWEESGRDSWCLHILILCALRGLTHQLWTSFGYMLFLVRRRRVIKDGVDYEQIDKEWDCYLILIFEDEDARDFIRAPRWLACSVPTPDDTMKDCEVEEENKHIRRGSPCINCSCWLLRILLLLGIVTLLSGVIFFLTVRPSVPTFNIARVVANTTRYKFMMMSRNKSLRMGFYYQRDGNVVLAYKSAEIAGGNTPEFYHGYKSVKEFEIVADGLKRALPKEVKRSLNGSREALPLTVSARFPVKLKVGSLRLWRMRMRILCDVKVRSLGKRTHVLSEKCKPKLRV